MQMIDVLKKLAELDSQPSTIAEESLNINECGMMPAESHSPAHISMSADSGHELADMLSQIMTLAGSKQDKEPLSSMPGEPAVGIEPKTSMEPEPGMAMRSIIDTMNDKVSEYDNTPADPTDKNEFDADQHANQENQPGQGDRMDGTAPKGNPTKGNPTMEEVEQDLFSQYKQFLEEN